VTRCTLSQGDPQGSHRLNDVLTAVAVATRDMIVDAWLDSANSPVGYPMVRLRDIECGKVRATRELFGAD
jgi:hypothetical protein